MRITKVRSAIINILKKTPSPLSIKEIIETLSAKGLKPNKTTVYREIDFLNKMGLVSGVDFGEGKKRYEAAAAHHHHIICIGCKKVKDVTEDIDLDKFSTQVAQKAGFKPVSHSLEFFGLCDKCR